MASRFIRGMPMVAILAGIATLGPTSPARATMQLMLSDTTDSQSVTITDNGVGDLNPLLGVVTFSGTVGEFAINVTTGESKPILGSATQPMMDINSLDTKLIGSAADTLTIKLTDQNFGPTSGATTLLESIGGTFNQSIQSVSYQAFQDPGNALFGMTNAGTLLSFSSSPFKGTGFLTYGAASNYSLTQVVTIAAGAGVGTASFDAALDPTPEPATVTMAFIGLPLMGFMAYRSRRRRAAV